MVVWISRKRAGHVTDPPVSRALSSLQWLIVKFVDIGMQRVHRVRSAELYVPATTGHTKTENQKALHYMQSDFRCSPTMNITEIFALLRLCLAKIVTDVSGQPIIHGRPKISFTLRRKSEVSQGT